MKYFAVVAAFIAAVSAQSISDLPACSLTCLLNAQSSTGCGATDIKCACGKSAQLAGSVTPCVQSACSAADQAKVITVLEGLCAAAGVPVTFGSGASSTPAPAPSSSAVVISDASSDLSPPASSTPAIYSTPVASTPAGYSSPAGVSTPAGASSSSYCTVTTSYTTVTASATATISYPAGNGTITTASPTQFTGAAAVNGAPVVAAGLFAALAYVL